jgi:hypothetical protein
MLDRIGIFLYNKNMKVNRTIEGKRTGMRKKSEQQIIRFDGKNVFVEVTNFAFSIEQVELGFYEYDANQERNSRIKQKVITYLSFADFLVLANDVLSGRMSKLAASEKQRKEDSKDRYARAIFTSLGGVSKEKLQAKGKERADGMALSRQIKITPGDRVPWILSGEQGPGEETATGLIAPKGRSEEVVRVPLDDDSIKKFFLVTQAHIQAYLASKYLQLTNKGAS